MGVTKTVISPGNGQQFPQKGDQISMHYTGCLYDENAPNKMGKQYVLPLPFSPLFKSLSFLSDVQKRVAIIYCIAILNGQKKDNVGKVNWHHTN